MKKPTSSSRHKRHFTSLILLMKKAKTEVLYKDLLHYQSKAPKPWPKENCAKVMLPSTTPVIVLHIQ